jgi:hypothetical protein
MESSSSLIEKIEQSLKSKRFAKLPIEHVTRISYNTIREWCILHGDYCLTLWYNLDEEEKHLYLMQVVYCLDHSPTDEDLHNFWLLAAVQKGWFIGEIYNLQSKRHPHLNNYWQLPEYLKTKVKLLNNLIQSIK